MHTYILRAFPFISSSGSPNVMVFSHFSPAKLRNVAVFVTNAPAIEAGHNY